MPRHNSSSRPVVDVLAHVPRVVTPLVTLATSVAITLSLASALPGQQAGAVQGISLAPVAEPFDPEVVLPARVDVSLHRTFDAVERGVAAVEDRYPERARRALHSATVGFRRAQKSVLHQVLAVTDPEAEDESTAGPDSALAGLNVAQVSVGELAGLFDGVRGASVVVAIRKALHAAQVKRADLLGVLTGLDPEGAGAAYADALTDTVPAYTDEVAAIQEALVDDRLTVTARSALQSALVRSQAAEATITAAYGGGE
jgi:hypothetical protein